MLHDATHIKADTLKRLRTGWWPERICALDTGRYAGLAWFRYKTDSINARSVSLPESLLDRMAVYGDMADTLCANNGLLLFELVHRHKGIGAAHHYGFYMYRLFEAAKKHGTMLLPVPVMTIKAKTAGKGKNNKADMQLWCSERFGTTSTLQHDVCDAIAILYTGLIMAGYDVNTLKWVNICNT